MPPPPWSDDRPTRLVQECAARAEQRWRVRAAAAFQEGAPPPDDGEALERCIAEASRLSAMEVEDLRRRLAQAEADRDAHGNRAEHEHVAREEADRREREALQASAEKLVDWLGLAAKDATPAAPPSTRRRRARSERARRLLHERASSRRTSAGTLA